MAVITAKFTGGDVLAKALRTLPVKVEKQIIREATRAAAEPVLHAAQAKAPVETGLLKSTLRITTSTSSRKGTFKARIQAGGKGAEEGKDYTGEAFYAPMIEYGHFAGHRRLGGAREWVEPKPFMRPAFDENVEKAIDIMIAKVRAGLEREGAMK